MVCHSGQVVAQSRREHYYRCGPRILVAVSADGSLPTEFVLFHSGWNPNRNGPPVLFDEAAAEAVMAAFGEHGVDLQIDLEHLSVAAGEVTGDARNFDPDARGWARLELRDGDLWAVEVTWTPDGAQRLRDKRQRYVSPAFWTDEDGRVTEIHNIALTATPATDNAQALVAARTRGTNMSPKILAELVRLVRDEKLGHEGALKRLAIDVKTLQSVVKAIGGDPGGDLGALIATVLAFADELQNPKKPDAEPPAEPPADAPAEGGDAMQAASASSDAAKVLRDGSAEVSRLRVEAKRLSDEVSILKRDLADREAAERHVLVAELVKLGRETPATAWADDTAMAPRGVLASMPIAELRQRVELFRGSPLPTSANRPAVGVSSALTDRERQICKDTGCEEAVFLKLRASRDAALNRGN